MEIYELAITITYNQKHNQNLFKSIKTRLARESYGLRNGAHTDCRQCLDRHVRK